MSLETGAENAGDRRALLVNMIGLFLLALVALLGLIYLLIKGRSTEATVLASLAASLGAQFGTLLTAPTRSRPPVIPAPDVSGTPQAASAPVAVVVTNDSDTPIPTEEVKDVSNTTIGAQVQAG